jgi:hypothetical protein
MERTTETLSTRDLASPNEQARGDTALEDDVRDTPNPEGESAPKDQAAPAGERRRTTLDEETPPPADEQTGVPGDQTVDEPAEASQAGLRQDRDSGAARPATDASASASEPAGSLLPADTDATFQERWKEIQTRFVDEPRGAVEDADGLVANLMQQLAEGFAAERERLEAQWGRGEDISTEDLRVALQRYRSFFQRLLST